MSYKSSFIAKSLFTVLIGGAFAATTQAQYRNEATATIPFAFSAQRANMAAGDYQINTLPDPFLLAIHKAGTGRDSIVTVRQEVSQSIPSHGYLVFRGDSGHLHLAEIHIEGTHTYSVVIQKREPKTTDIKIAFNSSSVDTALR